MPPTAEDIKRNLVDFARRWSLYGGSERAEAQTFLNQLFECYGTDRLEAGARFEEPQEGRFVDLLWPRHCVIEMKRPSEASRLEAHRAQAMKYWRGAADAARNIPAPQWVVLCAFHRFEVWEPGRFPDEPRASFSLRELPDQLDALAFLADADPVFVGTQEAVTRDAVRWMTQLYAALGDRRAADPDVLRDFLLQCVWCMFAEDLGQLEGHLFTRIVDGLLANQSRSSADDLGLLFDWLNRDEQRPPGGLYAATQYVNGGLFSNPAHVHLDQDELAVLRLAGEYDWQRVEPHIFGSLLEGALGREAQWALGAHYTSEADIQKVVQPSIVRPWQDRIRSANSLAEVRQLQNELSSFVVLDPACGSGNFLYVAYRELRRIERQLHNREEALRSAAGLRHAEQSALTAFFPLGNIKGIEINAFAVKLARVTLWMGHKLAVDELDLPEATLPLEDLSGIQTGDALRLSWPQASVIIGNPPFHGDRLLRGLLGDAYVEWLKDRFGAGVKDHCVYWFRKAQDRLGPGQRAGLVGTNSVSQNRARSASLNYIVENGGVLVDAVSTQDWPGAANVDVSIVNWINEPDGVPATLVLDGVEVEGIDTALEASTIPIADVPPIPANRGRAFQGVIPRGSGFVLEPDEAHQVLARTDVEYRDVIRPYLIGRDITTDPRQHPSRFIIDFGTLSLEDAMRYPAALDLVRERVKPARDLDPVYADIWWLLWRPRPELRTALSGLERFVAGTATAKRILFAWCDPDWLPSNLTNAFALDSDYAMAVLTSRVHTDWAGAKSSTLEDRIRYTPSSAFDTFPWPSPSDPQRELIAEVGRRLLARRLLLCSEHGIGLNELYNRVDEGAYQALGRLHRELDEAVVDAYGWSRDLLADVRERNIRLYDLNAQLTQGGDDDYVPF